MLTLQISNAEIAALRYEMYQYPDPIVQRRFHALYVKAKNPKNSCSIIGELVGLERQSVSKFIKIFNESGIESLKFNNYGTNHSELQKHQETIISNLESKPVHQISQAKARIEALTGITRSLSSVQVFLKRNGFTCKQIGHIPAKADTEKQEKYLQETLNPAIERANSGEIYLLFLDAAHFVLAAFLCQVWSKVRLFIQSPAGRQRLNVIGAIDAISKKVYTQSNTTYVNAQVMKGFLEYLRVQMPVLPIFIVLDNARYQHCDFIKDIALKLNITLLFLPAYSPNLNLIERLWKFVKKKTLHGKFYDKFDKFQNAIHTCLDDANKEYELEIKSLMNLKFQTFKNVNIYPV
jgi:transposase